MDDTIFAFAILSLGAFLGVLVAAFVYVTTVRPRLLTETTESSAVTIRDQQALVRDLQRQLAIHAFRWGEQLRAMQRQQDIQDDLTTELRAYRAERRQLTAPPPLDLAPLHQTLNEQRILLETLQQMVTENNGRLHQQQQGLAEQLGRNQNMLLRLTTLVEQHDQHDPQQLDDLMQQLDELASLVQEVKQQRSPTPIVVQSLPQASPAQDRLTDIKGIGPVYSGMLHDIGIHSFEQLAQATASDLAALLDTPIKRVAPWVKEAKQRVKVVRSES
ncbi:MAG: hypothetical protein H6673_13955 [Anaerolineales bacterium]|nr:hypothetical protein [Anaerolineales bacterium]